MAEPLTAAPYKIVKRGTKYVVVNNMGVTKASFDSKEEARKYQAALYVNVGGAAKRAQKTTWDGKQKRRERAAAKPIMMSDGKYPIATQKDAKDAWELRNHSTTHSEASVIAHIRRACQKLGLKFPGAEQDREKAMATGLHLTIAQLRELGREYNVEERKKAAKEGAALPDGSFPIYNQRDLDHGAELLHDTPDPTSARAHMVKRAKKLKLRLPYSWPEGRDQQRQQELDSAHHAHRLDLARQGAGETVPFAVAAREAAARRGSSLAVGSAYRPHGFVYPTGLPNCATCGQMAAAAVHINPMTPAQMQATSLRGGVEVAALGGDKRPHPRLVRAHPYTAPSRVTQNLTCQACKQPMNAQVHRPGLPVGVGIDYLLGSNDGPPGGGLSSSTLGGMTRSAEEPSLQRAFVTEAGGKVVIAAPASVLNDPEQLPRELAAAWQKASASNQHFLWLAGRFVEADRPNRNKAMWSTKDLELGEPTVANGPLNWLHEERHIIGSIADAKLVLVDREAAATGVGNHIAAAAVVWPWLWPNEAKMIEAASDENRLWYSMECISRQVACLSCQHEMTYRDYMTKAADRCGHMRMGEPRRFAQPSFLGGAVILPPVRPGWAHASVNVMRQASTEVERQAAAFVGMETEEAELLAAQIISTVQPENNEESGS